MIGRKNGLLMHITSLPSAFGIGDLGPEAYKFADLLHQTGQGVWQILPTTPTDPGAYNDPYHSTSAFAGNPLMISPELLVQDGLLAPADIADPPDFPKDHADFEMVAAYKNRLFDLAFENFNTDDPFFKRFCSDNSAWLEDFALFSAIKTEQGGPAWNKWPEPLRDRDPEALEQARRKHARHMTRTRFLQYVFFTQWNALKAYCRAKGVQIFGDMPIYVDLDSADLWAFPGMFKLDENKNPTVVAGVPPDYFSATGQLWGLPIYDWDEIEKTGFAWWIRRIERNLALCDILRIDHFRGLIAYWEVPAGEKTAMNGQWTKAPVMEFLTALTRRLPHLPVIAEDLGVITPDVREVMREFGFPGMKILQFAFGPGMSENPYIPHNIERNSVAYTGTHDNSPVRGWFDNEATDEEKAGLFSYLGREVAADEIAWEMIRLVMMSPADLAVIPVQDLLGLGSQARMNRPGNLKGNWHWRMEPGWLTGPVLDRLARMTRIYGRVR